MLTIILQTSRQERRILDLEDYKMKATGIVRRIDDLGRVVIPKEIRRTMRIREGAPSLNTLIQSEALVIALDKAFDKST